MLLWIAAAVAAFFVKGLCGFANTLVFTSVLSFGIDNLNISPIELLLGYPANFILTLQNKKRLKTLIVIPLTILVIAGIIPGTFLLKNVEGQYLKIFFGVVVVLIGVQTYLKEKFLRSSKRESEPSKVILVIVGFLSGILCGLFGVGALLAAYAGQISKSTDEFKANISAVFIVENTFRIVAYLLFGIITLETIKIVLLLLPIAVLALFAGIKCSHIISERTSKRIVIIALIISGLSLIIKNI